MMARVWARYALAGAGLIVPLAAVLTLWLVPGRAAAVWAAAALAYAVQLVACGVMIWGQDRAGADSGAFFKAWGGGTALRFGVLLAAGVWLAWSPVFAPAAMLLSFAGFLFLLLLLESMFFRTGLPSE